MSNLDIVRRSYDAFSRHDLDGFDPLDEEWWDGFTADPDEFLDAGNQVVVVGRYRATAKGTGKQLDVPFVHIWTLEGEKAIQFRQYLDTAGWVGALEG
jgi:ketosteroid isomerase-like protein